MLSSARACRGEAATARWQSRRLYSKGVYYGIVLGVTFIGSPCWAARPFSVTDDVELVRPVDSNSILFSPDSSYIVVHVERGRVDANRPEAVMRVYRTKDLKEFLRNPGDGEDALPLWTINEGAYRDGPAVTAVQWLSDSQAFVFQSRSASGNNQLYLADIATRAVRVLTPEAQDVNGFVIRNSENFVYCARVASQQRQKTLADNWAKAIVGTGRALDELLFPAESGPIMGFGARSELWAVLQGRRFRVEDKLTGRPAIIYPKGQQGQAILALSPDGHRLVTAMPVLDIPSSWEKLYASRDPASGISIKAGHQDLSVTFGYGYVNEYVLIDLLSGEQKPLLDTPIGTAAGWWSLEAVAWSSDGRSIALADTYLPPSSNRISSESVLSRPLGPCVVVVNLAEQRAECVTYIDRTSKDDLHGIGSVRFDPTNSSRVFIDYLSEKTVEPAVFVRTPNRAWSNDTSTEPRSGSDRPFELFIRQSLNDPPMLVGMTKATRLSNIVWNMNPQLANVDLGDASVFKWKDATGRDWIGGLYKPPNYERSLRYPLVIQNHGFPEDKFVPSGAYTTAFAARELAAVGIMVLQVRDCAIDGGIEEGPCQVKGYDAAVAKLAEGALIDPNNVGIVGFSRTCYYVMEALTMSTIVFKAASITDGNTQGYWPYLIASSFPDRMMAQDLQGSNGGPPFGRGLQEWLKRSPEFNMEEIKTPLQVVARGGGPGLLWMWEPYSGLRAQAKPVDLLILGEGTHELTNPAQRIVSQGGTVDWFRFWLQGYEDPDPAKIEQYRRWRELRKLQN